MLPYIPPLPVSLAPRLSDLSYVASGFELPLSGTLAAAAVSAGDASINSLRVVRSSVHAPGWAASSDSYVDLTHDGNLNAVFVITPVAVNAAAPAKVSDSIRLGRVRTDGTGVVASLARTKDSLGNWMRNPSLLSSCILFNASSGQVFTGGTAGYVSFPAGSEIFDNDYMHVLTPNDSIVTIQREGLYVVNGGVNSLGSGGSNLMALQIHRNGAFYGSVNQAIQQPTASTMGVGTGGAAYLLAGDTLAMNFVSIAGNVTLDRASLSVTRSG